MGKTGKNNTSHPATASNMVTMKDVEKKYPVGDGFFLALKNINLEVAQGQFLAVVGKSGSGKSTLINMLTGIDHPTGGEVRINGTDIHALSEGKMASWRGRNIGLVFQFFQLLPTLSVIENVMLPMDFCNLYGRKERKERAMMLLEQMDIAEQSHKRPSMLSGGQQQRIAIARALANDPPILIADEPTGNLDSKTADSVFSLFYDLVDSGKTIIMVTHDDDLAKRVNRVIQIHDGEIIKETWHNREP